MKPLIKHQMQPCQTSCVSTCVAMLLGVPAYEVISVHHEAYHAHKVSLREILDGYGVPFEAYASVDTPDLSRVGAYLITCPSLNIDAGMHQCIMELTEDDYYIIDPVKGREDRRYYVNRDAKGESQVGVGGYIVDAFIPRSWLESRQ